MGLRNFEDIEAWQLARTLTTAVYRLTKNGEFSRDFGLRDQIQRAAGSTMHNIAEGFDAESTNEFIRFLRYSKRSASEVQSELYVALDQGYLSTEAFGDTYELARRTRAATHGFISYLKTYKCQQVREACPEYGSEESSTDQQPWVFPDFAPPVTLPTVNLPTVNREP